MTRESYTFEFHPFVPVVVWDEINRLDTTRKTSGDLLIHILKLTTDLFFRAVTKLANEVAERCTFPGKL